MCDCFSFNPADGNHINKLVLLFDFWPLCRLELQQTRWLNVVYSLQLSALLRISQIHVVNVLIYMHFSVLTCQWWLGDVAKTIIVYNAVARLDIDPEMDMGWVHPWVGLGWVGLGRVGLGWVGLGRIFEHMRWVYRLGWVKVFYLYFFLSYC